MLNGRTAADTQRRVHFRRDDHGQGGLAQARWTGHEHVIGTASTHFGRLEYQGKLFADPVLAHEVMQVLRTERGLNDPLFRLLSPADQ